MGTAHPSDPDESLEPIGPRIPELREYVFELGTMVQNFGLLERELIRYVTLSNLLAENVKAPPLPLHTTVEPKPEDLTLGNLIRAFERHSTASGLVSNLRELKSDRDGIIHRTRRAVGPGMQLNVAGLDEQRREFRKILARLRPARRAVTRHSQNLTRTMIDLLANTLGPGHPLVQSLSADYAMVSKAIEKGP